MVDLKILKELGIDAESWRSLLETPSRETPTAQGTTGNLFPPEEPVSKDEKLLRLRNRIWSRITAGRDYNLSNWQHYHNLDLLWSAPFNQVSPTMVASVLEKHNYSEKAYDALESYRQGLSRLIQKSMYVDAKTNTERVYLDAPAFFSIVIPLVRSHLTIRKAKLINDRNLRPLFKFQAAASTPENRVKAEIVTDLVDNAAKDLAYIETIDQAVHQMLLYHYCIVFPRECYFTEEQLAYKEPGSGMTAADPDVGQFMPEHQDAIKRMNKVVTRGGLRYFIPHPTRTYFDQAYNQKTLNTDSGCNWAGHWRVMRFKELKGSRGFYNLDRISIGHNDWWTGANTYFSTVMGTCYVKFPILQVPEGMDREQWLASNQYYQSDYDDASVAVYEHYEKLIPSDDGLGDYPYPIWARFVVAGDGTIIYATPVGYNPTSAFVDNGDANLREEASMGLLLMPHQDQITNLLTQYLLTVKQNLANLTLIDQNLINDQMQRRIENLGEAFFRRLNIFPFDGKQVMKSQYGVPQAVFSHRFQYLDTNGILQAIRTVLDLAERVLQFSSQEVAQAASHEQTKAEVNVIANTTSNILTYTGRPVDNGMEAMARQNYYAILNYGEDDFIASIPSDQTISKAKLEEMGIQLISEYKKPGDPMQRSIVSGKKRKARLETFAITTGLYERQNDVQAAQAMALFLRDVMANPITGPAIGPDQAIMFANEVARLAGLPLPKPLSNTGMTPQKQAQQAQELVNGVIEQVMKMVKEGNQPILEAIKTNELMIENLYRALGLPTPNVAGEQNPDRAAEARRADMVATT